MGKIEIGPGCNTADVNYSYDQIIQLWCRQWVQFRLVFVVKVVVYYLRTKDSYFLYIISVLYVCVKSKRLYSKVHCNFPKYFIKVIILYFNKSLLLL